MKKFHRTPWRFEKTFETPLKHLESFAAAILGSPVWFDSGAVTIDAVVMPAKQLETLLRSSQLQHELRHGSTVVAESADEVHSLLVAALGDWVDFLFVPSPRPFVVYADHDEYATFFANTKSNLNKVTSALDRAGFMLVEDYIRRKE